MQMVMEIILLNSIFLYIRRPIDYNTETRLDLYFLLYLHLENQYDHHKTVYQCLKTVKEREHPRLALHNCYKQFTKSNFSVFPTYFSN